MIPLAEKLAYYFERVAGRDTIYSPVYTDEGKMIVWSKATPISGKEGRYKVTVNACESIPRYFPVIVDYTKKDNTDREGVTQLFAQEVSLHHGSKVTHNFAAKELPLPRPRQP